MSQQFDPSQALKRIRQASELPLSTGDALLQRNPYIQPHSSNRLEHVHYSNPSQGSYKEAIPQHYREYSNQAYQHPSYSLPLSNAQSQPKLPPHSSSAINLDYDPGFINHQDTVKPYSNQMPQLSVPQEPSSVNTRNTQRTNYTGMVVPAPAYNQFSNPGSSSENRGTSNAARSATDRLPTPPREYLENVNRLLEDPVEGYDQEEEEVSQVPVSERREYYDEEQRPLSKMEGVQDYLKEQHRRHIESSHEIPELKTRMKELESINQELLKKYESVLNEKDQIQKEKKTLAAKMHKMQKIIKTNKNPPHPIEELRIFRSPNSARRAENMPRQMPSNQMAPLTERDMRSSAKQMGGPMQKSASQIQNELELSGTLRAPLEVEKREPFSPAVSSNSLRFKNKQKLKLDVLAKIYKEVPTLKRAVIEIDFSNEIEMALSTQKL